MFVPPKKKPRMKTLWSRFRALLFSKTHTQSWHIHTACSWLPRKKKLMMKNIMILDPRTTIQIYMCSNIGFEENAVLHIHTVCPWLPKKKKAIMENIMIPDPHTTIQITCSRTLGSRRMLSVVCLLNSGISDYTNFVNMHIYNMYTHAPSTQNLCFPTLDSRRVSKSIVCLLNSDILDTDTDTEIVSVYCACVYMLYMYIYIWILYIYIYILLIRLNLNSSLWIRLNF